MIRRRIGRLAALLLVPAVAGCSIGDVRRPPPARTSAPSPPATTAPSPQAAVDEVRRVRVAVPRRYDHPYVEFVDARNGHALFSTCDGAPPDRDCPALLFATTDGGRSWRQLRHPRPVAENQQLYTASGVLVLLAEPHGWYTSTDGGATFAHSRQEGPPAAWVGAQGRFQVIEGRGAVGEWDGRRLRPLAAQPPVPGLQTVGMARDELMAVGVADDRPYAAVSTDRGRSWQRTEVPAPDGEVGVLRVVTAPDGEAWLVGERPDREGFPALWRYLGRWLPVRADRHPPRASSVAPVGAGRLAVTGPAGVGVVAEGRYDRVAWPLGPDHHLSVLPDGTILARGDADLLLSSDLGPSRRWAQVVFDRD